jgi:alkylhydroperoxidase/carboxymuconolactone decarboxylase family protein YurZ
MGQSRRFQETLRRLRVIDERFVDEHAGLNLDLTEDWVLDAKTIALVQLAGLVALGSPPVGLEWSATRALAAGASEEEIVDVLLAIASVTALSRVVAAVPEVAIALGYDIEAALEDSDDDSACHGPALRLDARPHQARGPAGQEGAIFASRGFSRTGLSGAP